MLALLGADWRSWADSGLKFAPKLAPQLVQIWSKKSSKTGPMLGLIFGLVSKGFATLPGAPSAPKCVTLSGRVPRASLARAQYSYTIPGKYQRQLPDIQQT